MAAQQHGPRPDTNASAANITPNDTADLTYVCNEVYVGGLGNLRVTCEDNTEATFTAVPVGTVLKLRIRKVWATNTTATNLVAMW